MRRLKEVFSSPQRILAGLQPLESAYTEASLLFATRRGNPEAPLLPFLKSTEPAAASGDEAAAVALASAHCLRGLLRSFASDVPGFGDCGFVCRSAEAHSPPHPAPANHPNAIEQAWPSKMLLVMMMSGFLCVFSFRRFGWQEIACSLGTH